jgi:formylglycine-generating enzyme required for sulfatase activity
MDPYKILGIEKDASPDEIRRAYRKKAAKYHPDKGGDTWIFQQIQDAYDQLTGKKKPEPPKPAASAQSDQQTSSADPFANDPFANDPFANDPFANDPFGFDSSDQPPERSYSPKYARPKKRGKKFPSQALPWIVGSIAIPLSVLLIGGVVWWNFPRNVGDRSGGDSIAQTDNITESNESPSKNPGSTNTPPANSRDNSPAPNLTVTLQEKAPTVPGQDPQNAPSSSNSKPAAGLKEMTNSIGMKLVLIPKGSFMMGSPPGEQYSRDDERQCKVTISKDYYLGAFEVTQAQYQKVMGNNPSFFQDVNIGNINSSNHPVEQVSWFNAMEFCRKLSELPEEKKAGRVYRLPTEAEWEYACRADSQTAFGFGPSARSLGEYAWFNGNSGGRTHPIGRKQPNAWGLYDMHGNVWEWCSDRFGAYPKTAVTDPKGPNEGPDRVIRGGSWTSEAANCRSAVRQAYPASLRSEFGFRVALSVPSDAPITITVESNDLLRKLAGTKWINSNNVRFEWTKDGRFLHNGIEKEYRLLNNSRVQIIFTPEHIDTLEFYDGGTKFKQLIKGGPTVFWGHRQ